MGAGAAPIDTTRAARLDAVLLTALLWGWAASGAYFWQLARARDAVLPYVPSAVWVVPGELWQVAPLVLVALAALAPLAALPLARRPAARRLRPVLGGLCGLVVLIAVVWGGALLRATQF